MTKRTASYLRFQKYVNGFVNCYHPITGERRASNLRKRILRSRKRGAALLQLEAYRESFSNVGPDWGCSEWM